MVLNNYWKILASVICVSVITTFFSKVFVIPLMLKKILVIDVKYVQNYLESGIDNGFFNAMLDKQNQSILNVNTYFVSGSKNPVNASNTTTRIRPVEPSWIRNVRNFYVILIRCTP